MSETIYPTDRPETIETTEPTGTALVAAVSENPGIVLVSAEKFDAFYAAIAADVKAHVADLTTDKGRKAVTALAFKVTKTWTAIEAAADALTDDAKALIRSVNDNKKGIKERLYGLRDEVKAPLIEWEEAEAARTAKVNGIIARIQESAKVSADDTLETVQARLDEVIATLIDPEFFGASFDRAGLDRAATIDILTVALVRIRQHEADKAELAELRRIKAERDEADRLAAVEAERVAAEAEADRKAREAAATAEANALEMQRQADERANAERIQREEAAAEAERLEAERIRAAEREAARKATQEAEDEAARVLRAAQDKADAAIKQAQDERDAAQAEAVRLHEERAAILREAARQHAESEAARLLAEGEELKRQANVAHRRKVLREAAAMIASMNGDDEMAHDIAEAIRDGKIPHVSMQF